MKQEVSYIMNSASGPKIPNALQETWVAIGDHENKDFIQVGTSSVYATG